MQAGADGVEHPVLMVLCYLTEAEHCYPPIEGEALALVWTVDHLRDLLEGHHMVVPTDYCPLVYIF